MRLKHKRVGRQPMAWILPALALSAGTGCITMGQSFRTEAVKSILVGKTRQSDVEQLFGLPYRTGIESGDLTWTYLNYHFSVLGTQQTTDLYVRFNSDGTVKSYAFNTNVPNNMPK